MDMYIRIPQDLLLFKFTVKLIRWFVDFSKMWYGTPPKKFFVYKRDYYNYDSTDNKVVSSVLYLVIVFITSVVVSLWIANPLIITLIWVLLEILEWIMKLVAFLNQDESDD